MHIRCIQKIASYTQKHVSGIRWFLRKSFNNKYLATDFTVKSMDFTAKIKKCIRESENQVAGYLIIRASGLWTAGNIRL
jgi:hypothetical protein